MATLSYQATLDETDVADDSGYGEGQFLGTVTAAADGSWRLAHPGRTRGPWIAATTSRYFIHGARTPAVEERRRGRGDDDLGVQ